MNFYKILFIFLLILLLLGCTNETITLEADNSIEKTEEKIETRANKFSVQDIRKDFNETNIDGESKIALSKYDMANGLCNVQFMTAPEYVDKETIIFVEFGKTSRIYEFDRAKETCKKIHEGIGIGSIVGLNKKMYWTEYDTSKMTNVEWKIKELDLLTNETKEITKGESINETPTPIVRSGNNNINWIEYKQDGKKIISQLKEYHQSNNKISVLEETILDEANEKLSNGEYFVLQQSAGENQALIYKSVFKNGKKSFDLSLYEKNKKRVFITNDVNASEFSIKDNYLAYGGGKVFSVVDTTTKNTFTYISQYYTTDSPIFVDDKKIIFREGMNEIFLIDFDKNEYFSVSKHQNTISKPIWTNNYLAYGIYDADGNDNIKLEFNIVEFK